MYRDRWITTPLPHCPTGMLADRYTVSMYIGIYLAERYIQYADRYIFGRQVHTVGQQVPIFLADRYIRVGRQVLIYLAAGISLVIYLHLADSYIFG